VNVNTSSHIPGIILIHVGRRIIGIEDPEKPDSLRFVRGAETRAQELGSHRTVAGAARCNPQILGSNPVQGGLEGKRHPFRCLKVAGLRFELRTFRL